MPKARFSSGRAIAVAVVVLSLTASLAGRFFHGTYSVTAEVHSSSSSYQKVQHRDKDAAEWVVPAAELCILWTAEESVALAPAPNPHARIHYESLYNRPPPLA